VGGFGLIRGSSSLTHIPPWRTASLISPMLNFFSWIRANFKEHAQSSAVLVMVNTRHSRLNGGIDTRGSSNVDETGEIATVSHERMSAYFAKLPIRVASPTTLFVPKFERDKTRMYKLLNLVSARLTDFRLSLIKFNQRSRHRVCC
jgi:hypothetical protein